MIGFWARQRVRMDGLLHRLSGGNPVFLRAPRLAQIEVTNRCNLLCRTCTRLQIPENGDMRFDDFARVIDQLGPLRWLWLSGQGEPLLHPELPRMVRYCRDRGIKGTILHTNATLLDSERTEALADCGLGELRISIDGGTAEDLEYLRRGAEMEEILANTARFARRSRTPVAFYTVLNRKSVRSVPLLPELAAGCGVHRIYAVETVPFRDLSAEREVFDRREYQFTGLSAKEQRDVLGRLQRAGKRHGVKVGVDLRWYRTACQDPSRRIYIDHRGNVTPCCRIHHEVFVGNAFTEGIDAVWRGAKLEDWRLKLRTRSLHPKICVERCNLGIGKK